MIVPPEKGDGDQVEAKAAAWATAFDGFLRRGGVIVVLATSNGTVERFGHGANLFDVQPVVVVTNQNTKIVDGTDSIANGVIAPYKAEATSVAFPAAIEGVVATTGGDVIVFHLSR